MSESHPWKCDICQRDITARESGFIEIVDVPKNAPPGGHPRTATPELTIPEELKGPTGSVNISDLFSLIPEPTIAFRACHQSCDLDERQGYWFDTARADTFEKWVLWTLHLVEKDWFGRTDMARMLGFWWSNRGLERPTVL